MSLAAGARLGPYDIVAPLGVGGMGEVYRARDAKLNRDVARRADIWAFGVVLCEMLTGRRAFDGVAVFITLASVVYSF